jgi:ABC-type polysaccharide/polyol phosphate transport system ATPase subunit
MPDIAIQVEDLSKQYTLGRALGGYVTLREVLTRLLPGQRVYPEQLWALQNLTFEVGEGEALGIIGPNGAGKSTLLKVLSRITHPTTGVSRTHGRVGSLLDVGMGFHPELTGRENVYFNGAILGMKRREIRQRYDEIIEFSGLSRFLETPLKRYSWGMWLRLAFAVAAHVEAEILIVDEVLAVGDARFRERCLNKMSELGRDGRTVIFVSHDLSSISRLCQRSLWLDRGQAQVLDRSEDVIEQYLRAATPVSHRAEFEHDAGQAVHLISAAVERSGPGEVEPRRGEPFTLALRFAIRERVAGLDIAVSVQNQKGVQILSESWSEHEGEVIDPRVLPQEFEIRLVVPPILAAGEYFATVWMGTGFETLVDQRVLGFRILPKSGDRSGEAGRNRIVQPDVRWSLTAVDESDRVENDG